MNKKKTNITLAKEGWTEKKKKKTSITLAKEGCLTQSYIKKETPIISLKGKEEELTMAKSPSTLVGGFKTISWSLWPSIWYKTRE